MDTGFFKNVFEDIGGFFLNILKIYFEFVGSPVIAILLLVAVIYIIFDRMFHSMLAFPVEKFGERLTGGLKWFFIFAIVFCAVYMIGNNLP